MNQIEIVIPCFNEARNLPGLIQLLEEIVEDSALRFVLVDNGSTDGSAVILKGFKCLKEVAQVLWCSPLKETLDIEGADIKSFIQERNICERRIKLTR